MITIYAFNKDSKKGYNIFKLEFQPRQFKNRTETFYKNVSTNKEACQIVSQLNGCKE